MKKRLLLLCLAVLLTAVPGCAWNQAEKQQDFVPGEVVSTYWFQFTLESAEEVDSYDGYRAGDGNRLLVCRISLENTFDDTVSMAQTDFFLLWEDPTSTTADTDTGLEGMVGTYALPHFSNRQLEDAYDLDREEMQEGDLVFEIPEEITQCALVFEEYYVDAESETGYSVGDHYAVWISLDEEQENENSEMEGN